MRISTPLSVALSLAAMGLLAGCPQSNTAYNAPAEVCGAPPSNVEQELTQQAQVEITEYVQGGTAAGNKRKLTQVLGEQGLMCDALAYRACMAANASSATPEQMRDMFKLALDSCQLRSALAPVPTTDTPTPPAPTPGPGPAPTASGEWRPGAYMTQAVALVTQSAQAIEARTTLGFDGDSSCVLGAFLARGAKINLSRSFEAGKHYAIIGGGAEGTVDLDLGILGPNGAIVAADTEDDATPVLEFVAPSSGSYQVILSLPGATVDGTFAALAIMKDGGFRVPAANISTSFGSTVQAAARASKLVPQKWPQLSGLVFHEKQDWSFYGTLLAQGETITFGGLDLEAAATVVMAGTDGQSTNVDLAVVETRTGRTMASDTDPDANPLVMFAPTRGQTYATRVTNVSSGGPSLVTTLILDAQ